jgi:hypothetical protein
MMSPLLYTLLMSMSAATSPRVCSCAELDVTTGGISARFGGNDGAVVPLPPRPVRVDTPSVAFVGQLVSVVEHPVPNRYPDPSEWTFVVEKRWRGPAGDTLHSTVGSVCAYPQVGQTYLVTGVVKNGDIAVSGCYGPRLYHGSTPYMDAQVDSVEELLGAPVWTAPPSGMRSYDRAPPPARPDGVTLIIYSGIPDDATVELVGTNQTIKDWASHKNDGFTGLSREFLYHLRLHMPDGRFEDHYVLPRITERDGSYRWLLLAMYPGTTARGFQK